MEKVSSLKGLNGGKQLERWAFLKAPLQDDSPVRWIALEHFPPHLTQELQESLRKYGQMARWELVDDLQEINGRAYTAGTPVAILVDCLHGEANGRLTYLLKKTLSHLSEFPQIRLIMILKDEFTEKNLPAVYGEGLVKDCLALLGDDTVTPDDRPLLQHSRRLYPKYSLNDLVMGPKTAMKLDESIQYIESKKFCEEEWGFRKRHSRGHGVTLLFHGPSGTGKTMAAEVVANTLNLPIYQIDLSSVVSKWVGETEKNLKSIFKAARGVKGILLFDEGDAIFGSRTEVKGSQDKYNNLEVNYLLQELEAFDGIVILSTNYERNLDAAFLRRFTYTVNFGFPSINERERIWKANVPAEMPVSDNADFRALAVFSLSGGNIKNCIRDAAAIAVAKKQKSVEQLDFLWAVKRESQKIGLEFTRESVGEQYWRKVGAEWEYLYFAKPTKQSEK